MEDVVIQSNGPRLETDIPAKAFENAPRAAERYFALEVAVLTVAPDGSYHAQSEMKERASYAKAEPSKYLARCEQLRTQPEPDRLAQLQRKAAAAEAAYSKLISSQDATLRARQATLRTFNNVRNFVLRAGALFDVDVTHAKGATVDGLLKTLHDLHEARWQADNAPPPPAEAIARIVKQVDQAAAPPRATLRELHLNRKGAVRLDPLVSWPMRHVGDPAAETYAIDAAAIAIAVNRDAIIAKLTADLEAAYKGIKVTHTTESRRAELKRVDALIQAAERQASELLWSQFDGENLPVFPALLSPAALLGVK